MHRNVIFADRDGDPVRDVQEGHDLQELQGAGRGDQAEAASLPLQRRQGRVDPLRSHRLHQELHQGGL